LQIHIHLIDHPTAQHRNMIAHLLELGRDAGDVFAEDQVSVLDLGPPAVEFAADTTEIRYAALDVVDILGSEPDRPSLAQTFEWNRSLSSPENPDPLAETFLVYHQLLLQAFAEGE